MALVQSQQSTAEKTPHKQRGFLMHCIFCARSELPIDRHTGSAEGTTWVYPSSRPSFATHLRTASLLSMQVTNSLVAAIAESISAGVRMESNIAAKLTPGPGS